MAPEHAVDVEGRGLEALGDGQDFRRRHEQEHGLRIDEAPDEPRAGDAVDLRPRPRHPHRAAALVAGRQLVGAHEQLAASLPGLEAALQRLCVQPIVAHQGGDALAELEPFLTGDDDALARVVADPCGGGAEVAPAGAWQQPRVGGVVLIDAHVDDGRRAGQADQAGKLSCGDFGR